MSDTQIVSMPDAGMLSIRADLEAHGSSISKALGIELPDPLSATQLGSAALLWFSPDELLLACQPTDLSRYQTALAQELEGCHYLVADVSDMRAGLSLTGPRLREVLAKLVPVDLHEDAFGVGQVRRTRLGQAAAAVWLLEEDVAVVLCFRSYAVYAEKLISHACDPLARVDASTYG